MQTQLANILTTPQPARTRPATTSSAAGSHLSTPTTGGHRSVATENGSSQSGQPIFTLPAEGTGRPVGKSDARSIPQAVEKIITLIESMLAGADTGGLPESMRQNLAQLVESLKPSLEDGQSDPAALMAMVAPLIESGDMPVEPARLQELVDSVQNLIETAQGTAEEGGDRPEWPAATPTRSQRADPPANDQPLGTQFADTPARPAGKSTNIEDGPEASRPTVESQPISEPVQVTGSQVTLPDDNNMAASSATENKVNPQQAVASRTNQPVNTPPATSPTGETQVSQTEAAGTDRATAARPAAQAQVADLAAESADPKAPPTDRSRPRLVKGMKATNESIDANGESTTEPSKPVLNKPVAQHISPKPTESSPQTADVSSSPASPQETASGVGKSLGETMAAEQKTATAAVFDRPEESTVEVTTRPPTETAAMNMQVSGSVPVEPSQAGADSVAGTWSAAPAAVTTSAAQSGPDQVSAFSDQVVTHVIANRDSINEQMVVQLNPPELGKLRIQFTDNGRELTGVIRVDHPETLSEMKHELPALLGRLNEAGIQVKSMDCMLNDTSQQDRGDAQPQAQNAFNMYQQHSPGQDHRGYPTASTAAGQGEGLYITEDPTAQRVDGGYVSETTLNVMI